MYWFSAIGQRTAWLFVKPLFHFFLHLRVLGKENIKGSKDPVILAVNHISELDGPMLPVSIDFFSPLLPIIFVSLEKKRYKGNYYPSFIYSTIVFRLVGMYPATIGLKNYERSLATHINFLKKGVSVAIFLEGKCKTSTSVQKVKGGVIELVKQTGCPVIPVAISGHYLSKRKDFFFRKKHSILSFGKPILKEEIFEGYENISYSNYENIAKEKIMVKIESLLDGHVKERASRGVREKS
ncbi:MAG: 1-acyl-sn-glycerol-3-phosphate acyltransferase [Candidatus Pacebacteria bacterium]|nr:1-acyl-sn-glycerol-3-phosphate acyltransferase [Candidatus Paceibacterota bacterium]